MEKKNITYSYYWWQLEIYIAILTNDMWLGNLPTTDLNFLSTLEM